MAQGMYSRGGLPSGAGLSMGVPADLGGSRADLLFANFQEVLYWPLYSSDLVTAASLVSNFFAVIPAQELISNHSTPNTIPSPQMYAIRAIGVQFDPIVIDVDAILMASSDVLRLTLNDRLQFQLPIMWLPGMGGVQISNNVAAAGIGETAQIGPPGTSFGAHWFPTPVILSANETFSCQILWQGVGMGAISASTRVWVIFLGTLARKPVAQ